MRLTEAVASRELLLRELDHRVKNLFAVVSGLVTFSARGTATPQAISLRLRFDAAGEAAIRRAGAAATQQPVFEVSRHGGGALGYLVVFDGLTLGDGGSVIAEVELPADVVPGSRIELDPSLTMLSDAGGTRIATVAAGALEVRGTTIPNDAPKARTHE
jgi:hypothetical protein